MNTLKTLEGNISELQKILIGQEEALEFLEAIKNNIDEINDSNSNHIQNLRSEISGLYNQIEKPDFYIHETLLGDIFYLCENLKHEMLLRDYIEKTFK